VYEFFTSDPSWMDIKWNSNAWKNVSVIGGPITIPYEKDMTIGSVMLKWDIFIPEFNITSAGKVEENMVVGYVHIRISQDLIILPLQVSTKKLVAELIVPLLKKEFINKDKPPEESNIGGIEISSSSFVIFWVSFEKDTSLNWIKKMCYFQSFFLKKIFIRLIMIRFSQI